MTENFTRNPNLRNIAIIAHVDHGKTTLVNSMFTQSGVFREGVDIDDRLMDNLDLERERGITITAKNCSVDWDGVKINILDTPGHADFGGEVERALMMVDGVILLVDAAEGPLPQTRFVLQKALQADLKVIVCLNKIDRGDARPEEVLNEIYDLFIDLDATDEQADFPILYAIGRDGIVQPSLEEPRKDLKLLFETILSEIPGPKYDPAEPFQMIVANLDYSEYLGRLAIGKAVNGSIKSKESLVRIDKDGQNKALRVVKVQNYQGTGLGEISTTEPGEIVIISGIDEVEIGDTICTRDEPKALPRITVDEPTVSMRFAANNSPLAGQEGKYVQSQRIGERLAKEALFNVGLQFEAADGDAFIVKGRGEFQLAIVIETMRREGFELCVGRPRIIFKEEDGVQLEPIEHLFVDCEEAYVGTVTDKLSIRKGRMVNMINHGTGRVRLEFSAPSRSLIGYRNQFLTDTKGTGIMSSYLEGYEPYRGDFPTRSNGSLVADRQGQAIPYAIFGLEARGKMFVTPGEKVYEGMVVGEHSLANDLNVNICRTKKMTNVRASGKDDAVTLTPVTPPTLEQAIDFIRDNELVEVTPLSIRIRKTVLPANKRKSDV
jgi:GTP-binding protein